MRILILDDVKSRHDAFDRIYSGDTVVHAYRYMEFLEHLKDGVWDLIHLDHDLGDFVDNPDTYVDGWGNVCEYNGAHASMRVCEMDDPPPVIVHSINPVGAKVIVDNLKRRGISVVWEPFGEVS